MPNDQPNSTNENFCERACFTFFGRERADLISAMSGATLGSFIGLMSNMTIDYTFFPCGNFGCETTNRLIWVATGFVLVSTGAITGAFCFNLVSRGIHAMFKCLTEYQEIPDVEEGINSSPQLK